MSRCMIVFLLLITLVTGVAAQPNAARHVSIKASDGAMLRATYYAASKPGPGVLLHHMCNTDRKSWEPLGSQLAAAGIHALALDYRGYGESTGERYVDDPQRQQQVITEKWPDDVDAALAYLLAQPGVSKSALGAAGGSCGVNQAIQAARRNPQIKALVLLAGGTNRAGREHLRDTAPPVFAAAAADDQFDRNAPLTMEWMAAVSGNPHNKFMRFEDGKHGTEIFPVHPELPRAIVAWLKETLSKPPADAKSSAGAKKKNAMAEFWELADQPGRTADAIALYREAKKRDPKVTLFPEGAMNLLCYERMQAQQVEDAIALCKLNTEAYPDSANTYDSLGDAYAAAGNTELAVEAAKKALAMLPADQSNEQVKEAIRQSAEQKLKLAKNPT